jgi:hypothetical protein
MLDRKRLNEQIFIAALEASSQLQLAKDVREILWSRNGTNKFVLKIYAINLNSLKKLIDFTQAIYSSLSCKFEISKNIIIEILKQNRTKQSQYQCRMSITYLFTAFSRLLLQAQLRVTKARTTS